MKASLSPEARLALLWQASHTLGSSLDYETNLRGLARLVVPTLADWAAVDLADEQGRLERLAVVHVDPERERWGWEVHRRYPSDPASSQGPYQVLRTGEPLVLSHIPDDMLVQTARDADHLHLLRTLGLASAIVVPIAGRAQRLGVLTLVTAESGRRYGPDELTLAQELAGRAALAVENARLYLAEQRARAKAEAAAEHSARLLALSSALARDLSAAEVAGTSLDHALSALGAWAGSFYVLPPGDDALELLHHQGYPDDLAAEWRRIALDAAVPLAEAVRSGPIFLADLACRAERYPHLGEARARLGGGALVAVPLVAHGHPIGAMGLTFREPRAFTPDDRDFVRILAGHCAQALDRALTVRALQESEARFRSVIESGMLGIGFWDGEQVTECNDELLALLGYDRDDLRAGRLRHGALTPREYEAADARAYAECLERGTCRPYEKEFFRKDGSRVPVLAGGSLLGGTRNTGVFFVLDLTERRRAEAQVQASQRMDAVGRLAGGVAHEINNALQGVLGFAGFVRRSLPPDDPRARDVHEIIKAGSRAAEITHQLLAFSRRQVRQPTVLDVGQVVREFTPMLQQALGPERELALDLPDAPAVVHADRGQLEQVLLNLTLNARDAMPGGGVFTVSVDRVRVGPSVAAVVQSRDDPWHPPPGDYVRLGTRDAGTGMSAELQERAFEPFFTTKAQGQGTGLGLSVVYGIVRQSGGFITVESAPGAGATFRIHLPAAQEPVPTAGAPPPPPPGGSETILVVDDEPGVLAVAARTLEEAGYRVLTARDGREALAVVERTPEIALVFSDLLMPALGGEALARRLAVLRPDVRVLLISGHPDGRATAGNSSASGAVLFKPFEPEQLLRIVREALDRKA